MKMTGKSTINRPKPVRQYFQALMEHWGPQDWWPAYSRLEVIAGAFLTQNTSWKNVEGALRNLRQRGLLNLDGLRKVAVRELETAVRPSGYFRQKAQRLKNFVQFLDARYNGSLTRMFSRPTPELRQELLELDGVGPETADAILLYAGGHPVFVVDAYTRRVFERHSVLNGKEDYETIRQLFENAWQEAPILEWQGAAFLPRTLLKGRKRHKFTLRSAPQRARVFDEYHALLVQVAKHHCHKKEPLCQGCPLESFLPIRGPLPVRAARRKRKRKNGPAT
jgi:endonuclease-3 related protein